MDEATLATLLAEMSAAFRGRDLDGLLATFSAAPTVTYAGSEAGETATGTAAVRHLLAELLAGEMAFSFRFPSPTWGEAAGAVWVLADGEGVASGPGREAEVFAYRLAGVLVQEAGRWRWGLLTGSEPTRP